MAIRSQVPLKTEGDITSCPTCGYPVRIIYRDGKHADHYEPIIDHSMHKTLMAAVSDGLALQDKLADQAIDRDLDLVVDGGWLTPFLQFPEFGRSPLLAFAVAKAGGGMPAPAVRLGPARVILCRGEVAVEFGEQRFVVCGREASVSGQPRGRAGLL